MNGRRLLREIVAEEAEPKEWVRLSSVRMRSIEFADYPLLQRAAFHLFAGRKGVGKGTLVSSTAARVTRGELGEKRNVVWIGSEDSAAIDIKPRLVAAGGDDDRVVIVKTWIQLPGDVPVLERIVEEVGDVGLVVIDPVGNHISGKNSNAETDVRDAIAPLNELADVHDLILVGVRHLSEKDASRGVLASILGSSAWVQTPRVVLAVVQDDEDDAVRHVQCVAGNRLPPGTHGRAFRIEPVQLAGLAQPVTRAVWVGESSKDVEDLLAAKRQTSGSALARDLILDTLENAPGLQMESDALDALVAEHTGLTAKTVKNQRGKLRDRGLIKTLPEKDEHGTILRWLVVRTHAPRDDAQNPAPAPDNGSQIPTLPPPDPGFRSTTPDPVQIPTHDDTGPGEPDPDSTYRDLARDLDAPETRR